jgi:hypothetical protein
LRRASKPSRWLSSTVGTLYDQQGDALTWNPCSWSRFLQHRWMPSDSLLRVSKTSGRSKCLPSQSGSVYYHQHVGRRPFSHHGYWRMRTRSVLSLTTIQVLLAILTYVLIDYDRLQFAPVETQKIGFRLQLSLAKKHHLPLFLHSRAAHADFVSILKAEGFGTDGGRAVGAKGGVAHSFTGTPQEAADLVCFT